MHKKFWRSQVAFSNLAPACAQRRSQKVNEATPSLSHSPAKAPLPVRTHCMNAGWNKCKTDLNSFPRRKLDETTGTSSYYMDENHSAGSEIQRPQYRQRSWPGSEPSTLETDVYVRRYALLVVLARNDDDDDLVSHQVLMWNNVPRVISQVNLMVTLTCAMCTEQSTLIHKYFQVMHRSLGLRLTHGLASQRLTLTLWWLTSCTLLHTKFWHVVEQSGIS